METPPWISKKLFESALQQFLNRNDVEVIEYSGSAYASSGESFCSEIFRSTITYKVHQSKEFQTMRVLVKRPPETKQSIRYTEELNYFKKEIQMYRVTLPELNRILGNLGTLSARSLYANLEPHPLLIVEDVSPKGYKMLDRRQKGLDLEECLCVVRKLAQFHAASLVLHDKDPKAFDIYSESMFSGKPVVVEWIKLSTETLIKALQMQADLKQYAVKLEQIKHKIAERAAAAAKPKPDGFNVLNHGDPWPTNFLFSYHNNEEIKDMILVDYQVVAFGSPTIDLHYFWATSPTIEVHQKHFDTILTSYYYNLLLTLKNLNFVPSNLLSFEDLKEEWISKAYYGFVSAIAVMPLIKCDKRDDATWDYLLAPEDGDGSFRHHVFNNPVALEHLRNKLPFYDQLGVLDYQ